jgi:hypothetical protein
VPVVRPDTGHPSQPDDGRPGRIRHGIRITLSSTKTLIGNRQLLWFSLFTGLVLAGHLIAQWVLILVNMNNGPDLIGSPVVAFAFELPTVFCLVFLLAGLVLSLSSETGGPVSFLHGFRMAGKYLIPLTGWSVVVALLGTLIFIAGGISSGALNSMQLHSFDIYGNLEIFLSNVFSQYPFNWSLDPDVFIAHPPGGNLPVLAPGFPGAFVETLFFSAINVLLFVLTLFVVPLLVLERKRLKEAVSGSFTLMKKYWAEVAACVLGLGMVVFAASLTFLLFQFTGISQVDVLNGMTSISSSRPGDAWIALGLLYALALSGFVFIVATVGGIASLGLYRYAKIRGSTV